MQYKITNIKLLFILEAIEQWQIIKYREKRKRVME